MKITVTIDLEDHPTPLGSRLSYAYAIDPHQEDELRVPAEPPFPGDMHSLMRWQDRREHARQIVKLISDNIGAAVGHALETGSDGR